VVLGVVLRDVLGAGSPGPTAGYWVTYSL
jgi:hypothetical protein